MTAQSSHRIDCLRTEETRLQVHVSRKPDQPSAAHQLLLAFHFGEAHSATDHPAVISPGLVPVNGEDLYECWWYAGEVRYESDGQIQIADCDDYSVATYSCEDVGNNNFDTRTHKVYMDLFNALSKGKHCQPVKIWNYLGGINDGDDDKERYRQFSAGRASAFRELEIQDDVSPTGTAIGTSGSAGLSVIAIATDKNFRLIENPRQVSAFQYPRQYGPSSPKFGRAGYVSAGDHKLYLISGTASVVGHQSAHPYDVQKQLDEILTNLDALCTSISTHDSDGRNLVLDNDSILRVYLRRSEDYDAIKANLHAALLLDGRQVLYLQGDICRRELMVEIDGVKVR